MSSLPVEEIVDQAQELGDWLLRQTGVPGSWVFAAIVGLGALWIVMRHWPPRGKD